jgi:hypothetical protein
MMWVLAMAMAMATGEPTDATESAVRSSSVRSCIFDAYFPNHRRSSKTEGVCFLLLVHVLCGARSLLTSEKMSRQAFIGPSLCPLQHAIPLKDSLH